MIIYYAMTKFHLIFSIVHKRRTYGDQEAVLFVYSGLQGIEEERERIPGGWIFPGDLSGAGNRVEERLDAFKR